MKKFYLTIFFVFVYGGLYAQEKLQETLFLKNGSILKGIIIEQIPGKSIKIQTSDGNIFVYGMEEIEKISNEFSFERSNTGSDVSLLNRRGFIGLSIGPSFPTGDFSSNGNFAQTGLNLNLIKFGYNFSKNFGISSSWFGASNPLSYDGYDSWSYGGIVIGPMVSLPVSRKLDFDFIPFVGYSLVRHPIMAYYKDYGYSIAQGLSSLIRFKISERTLLFFNLEYFFANPEFSMDSSYGYYPTIRQEISTFSMGLGFGYRLK